jgi:tetratricopeptide (TPR) repeat protein
VLNNFHKGKAKGEDVMKKAVISVIMFFALFVLSNTTLAKMNNGYETALHHYYKGEYEKAIRLFKEIAKEKPDSSVYYYIGYALYKTRKYDEACKYFKMTYLLDPRFSPNQNISFQKHQKTKKEIIKPQGEKDTSKIPSAAEKEEKQIKGRKGSSVRDEERSKAMVLLTLIYIFAHKKG